uniref:CDK-activating kinase assembly factor MAT1 n=1 Tax=Eptatretus burgeri TaxID=7764 RepID=A0A8C4QR86_EPTBU
MEEQCCPHCKTTKYRNPSLRLMVNICGHTLCESCVELLFARGAGNCPECETPLRKHAFRFQLFDDPLVDKEVDIRKKVLKTYNKREEDFATLREFNDYLEEIEDIVYKLTRNVDVENTKRKMDIYQRENKDIIQKNRIRLSMEHEDLVEGLEEERRETASRRLAVHEQERHQRLEKHRQQQSLLDELEASQLPASLLVTQHRTRQAQREQQHEPFHKPNPLQAIKVQVCMQPPPRCEEVLFHYEPLVLETLGPPSPEAKDLGRLG